MEDSGKDFLVKGSTLFVKDPKGLTGTLRCKGQCKVKVDFQMVMIEDAFEEIGHCLTDYQKPKMMYPNLTPQPEAIIIAYHTCLI